MPPCFASYAILPAAGRSLRMGQPKLLMPWRDATVIEYVLRAWLASQVTQTIVVLHPEDTRLAEVCRGAGAEVVIAREPPLDMKASIRLGLEHVARRHPRPEDVWLVAPADMPTLTAKIINQVLAAHRASDRQIAVPEHRGRRGHPVLFPWPLAEQVASLGPSEGLNALVEKGPMTAVPIDDPAVLADLDTPDDYQSLRNESRHA